MVIRPRRSVLYVPGTNARALDKARALAVDAVILDLEDSVPPEGKEAARAQVTKAVAAAAFGTREVIVRINGLDTDWWLDDLNAAARAKPHAILVPKVSIPGHLEDVLSFRVTDQRGRSGMVDLAGVWSHRPDAVTPAKRAVVG